MTEHAIVWIIIILAALYTGKRFFNQWKNGSKKNSASSCGCSCSGCSDSKCDSKTSKPFPEKP